MTGKTQNPAYAGMSTEELKRFKYWELRTIAMCIFGYALFYFVRKNLSIAMPYLNEEMGISKSDLGLFLTLHGLIYGLSKFFNGIWGDRSNARYFLVTGLVFCGICNLLFGFSSSVLALGIFWVLNGWFQGMGVPPCTRLMTHWIVPERLATKMSIWNTSHSIGAGLAIIFCGYIVSLTWGAWFDASSLLSQHWRWCFLLPATIALLGAAVVWALVRDTPSSVGLPELKTGKSQTPKPQTRAEEKAEYKAFLRRKVFLNPTIWIIAVGNFFVYVVRFAVLDWGPTFLQESRGLSSSMAGWTVAIFEVCGITGMLLAGWISDKFFGGRAQRTCVFCMAGVILFISLFFALPESTDPVVLLMMLAVAGFFIYGPQALIGVIASNHATKKAASTANGVVGMVSYVSVVVSGWGFGFISDHFGWRWVFITMIAMAVLGFLVLLSMWNTKSDGYEHDAAETN